MDLEITAVDPAQDHSYSTLNSQRIDAIIDNNNYKSRPNSTVKRGPREPPSVKLPATVSSEDVASVFREPYVLNGYRVPHQPYSYYLLSSFQLQNECMNVWTHVLAFIVSLLLLKYRYIPELGDLSNPYTWPFLVGYGTVLTLYLFSSIAHSCHSKSQWCHYNFFMLDYCGVGLYGLGTGIHHYYYSGEDWFIVPLQNIYLPVLVVLSVLTCWGSSYYKVKCDRPYPWTRKLAQCGSVGLMYVWIVMPLFSRFFKCYFPSLGVRAICDQSLNMHIAQVISFLLAAVFFSSHLPHRLNPGKFDIFLHGHQLFHLFILLTSLCADEAVFIDLKSKLSSPNRRVPSNIYSMLCPVVLVVIGEIILIIWLRRFLSRKLLDQKAKQT